MPGFWPALVSILDTLAVETRAPLDPQSERELAVSDATTDIHDVGHREQLAVPQWWFATRLFYTEHFLGYGIKHSIEQLKWLTLAFVILIAISATAIVKRIVAPTNLLILRLFVTFILYVYCGWLCMPGC